jgi:hypothetical protein
MEKERALGLLREKIQEINDANEKKILEVQARSEGGIIFN